MQPRERISLEPAYVLHSREYRDTSRILDVFTARHGRITLFARGARGPKSKLASLLMPFRPLLVSWSGRGEAAQLTGAELQGDSPALPPRCKYHPSCSAYAVQAIERYGILRGVVLAGWRVLRCNPWSHGGYDPPEAQTLFARRATHTHP